MPVNVQVSEVVPAQVQSLPEALTRVIPAGSGSVSVMLPNVASHPSS